MVIIINGSVGVGKSSVSWQLLERFEKSIMLDGDYIGAVHPFEIYDAQRTEYLYDTIAHLMAFHMKNGYNDFVINYVFENANQLNSLVNRLEKLGQELYCFYLTCSDEEQKKRILKRNRDENEWELKRFTELNRILEAASKSDFIGERVDTDGKSIEIIADYIFNQIRDKKV